MGVSTPKISDRRVRRTREALRDAFMSLLLERDWDQLSVQDVCDRANVGRSTFYTHFADKEELVVGGFEDLRRMIRAGIAGPAGAGPALHFVRGILEHAAEHRRLFQALMGKRSSQVVLRRVRELVVSLVREDLTALRHPGPLLEPTIHFVAGAFIDLLTWWLESRNALQPADVEQLFLQLAAPAVELAAGRKPAP
jgi:AcrR family transcriptional regulator